MKTTKTGEGLRTVFTEPPLRVDGGLALAPLTPVNGENREDGGGSPHPATRAPRIDKKHRNTPVRAWLKLAFS